jgi:hypothetical protein
MSLPPDPKMNVMASLDPLDRWAIAYLTVPMVIFLVGWFEWWVALPLVLGVAFALRPLVAALPARDVRLPLTGLQIAVAIVVGCGWTLFGGAGHLLFANADWFVRDAVLHDLVVSPWPVGYGLLDGKESLLRAPVAFYLPAALAGKWLGLVAAHWIMGLWTAMGASLFLLQVLSLVPSRGSMVLMTAAVVVLFSGFDIVGNVINTGPRFIANWRVAQHIEWWAGSYQYSSMTTQLFWVPNHAIGGWLMIGLMARIPRFSSLDAVLPMLTVAAALWSPLSALGIVPFVLWRVLRQLANGGHWSLLHPRVWMPALLVGAVVASYLILDSGGVPKGITVGGGSALDKMMDLLRQTQFFLLEAGFVGLAILMIRRSSDVVLALILLALLPLAYLGPGNDLVMRGSIPSLAALVIGACLALSREATDPGLRRKKIVLLCMLAIGSVTAVQEFARAMVLNAWPINLQATLIGANCGGYPPHYVARLGSQVVHYLLRAPHRLTVAPLNMHSCHNPAFELMWKGGLL